MPDYLVWGGGGHGKVVADVARAAGLGVAGFIDADPAKMATMAEPGGARVVTSQADFLGQVRTDGLPAGIAGIILAIGDNAVRRSCRTSIDGIPLPVVIHPHAVVSPHASLGSGTVVMPGAIINAGAVIGAGVIVNTGATIEHDCIVGDDAHIAPRAVLTGNVNIGELALVGAGAVIIRGVTVGSGSIIGAGAVVIREVPVGVTVAGNPAKPIND